MDFYSLDYLFAEAQFVAGLNSNLHESFEFVRESGGFVQTTVTSTYFCRREFDCSTLDHVAAQSVIDKGIEFFTDTLRSSSAQGIKFKRIEVIKSLGASPANNMVTFGLLVDYSLPVGKSIKTFK